MNPNEIKNQVLTENTAQGVLNHLKALESNRARMQTRWIWELLQNARDTSPDDGKRLVASVKYEQGELIFQHNGAKFKIKEIAHLIYHGSTKFEDEETIGQYGSGFLTTHLLSPTIDVSGQLEDGKFFKFCLTREIGSVKELSESMDKAWESFNDSQSEIPPSDFTTQFRYPVADDAADAVAEGLEMLKRCAPFVIVFNQEFSKIKITTPDEKVSFKVVEPPHLQEDGLQEITVEESKSRTLTTYISAKGEKTSVAIPLSTDDDRTCLPVEDVPRLFLGFPLIGTDNFSFPAVINSFEFTPTEDRDGVYLGQSDNEANRENQQIIVEACDLLTNVLQFAAESRWRNTYVLANVPVIQGQSWLNTVWLRDNLKEQFIEKIRQTSAVLNEDGVAIAPEEAWLPVAETADGITALWDLLSGWQGGHEILPRRNEAVGWWSALNSWAIVYECQVSSFNESIDGQKLAESIDNKTHIGEDHGKIEDLQNLLQENISAVEWLNQLHDFFNKNSLSNEVREYHIVLDQGGWLDKVDILYLDQDISKKMKDVAEVLGWKIRQELRDKRLSSLSEEIGAGVRGNRYVVQQLIEKLQDRKKLDDSFAEASVSIFAWITSQRDWNLLRDFPTFSEDGGTGDPRSIKLERDPENEDQPLAPVRAWKDNLQPYSELFPWRYILADAFFEAVPDPDIWQELDEQGFLKRSVMITKNVHFDTFLPDEPLTEEEEEEEHKTTECVDVTNIAFLTRDDIGIMARVRQNRHLARIFWRFLTEWLIRHDPKGLEINTALCDCEKHHKYYPAEWLVPLIRNKWVPLGKRRAGQATAESLANLLRDSEWNPSTLEENFAAVELLKAIGVTQFDLLREFVATNEKERNEQNEIFTKILVATSGDLSPISEFVQDLEDDEDLLPHLAERRKQRQIGRENHHLGQQVEEWVKELLEDNGFAVCRTGTGSDYKISIDKDGQSWLVEVKATRDQRVRMTAIQAKTAVEQGEKFLLCVVPVESGEPEPELDTVRDNMRFVENIGPRVDQLCSDLNGFEELRDEITANEFSGVRLEVEAGAAGVRVASSVWEKDGFRLEDLAEHLK